MKRHLAVIAALPAFLALAVAAQDGPADMQAELARPDLPGRTLFAQQCAPCHGTGPGDDGSPTLPGTAALDRKYAGSLPGALELRSDLSAPVLRAILRRGSGAMPMFRAAELSDAQIDEIAEYLAVLAADNLGRGEYRPNE